MPFTSISAADKVIAKCGEISIVDFIDSATELTMTNGCTIAEALAEFPGAEVMTLGGWEEAAIATQPAEVAWIPIDEKKHDYYLEVLPPAVMVRNGFLVGEPADHCVRTCRARYQAVIGVGGKYYASSRPMTKDEFRDAAQRVAAEGLPV